MAMACSACGWAADGATPAAGPPSVTLTLEAAGVRAAESRPGDARLARVSGWITERVPACPPDAAIGAAQQFLQELEERHPEQLDRLLAADFPVREIESPLLRQVAVQLTGPRWTSLREELARRRVEIVLASAETGRVASGSANAAGLIAKLKKSSEVQYRRLLDGRLEDDDLAQVLRKAGQTASGPGPLVPAAPKTLTAADIVSEFARRNQEGSALGRMQAYVVEGRLRPAAGEEQHLLLFKMRPDRFRLVVQVAGSTRLIVAGEGHHFWQQSPGQPVQTVAPEAMGAQRYMAEFADPLLTSEGYAYERLADGAADQQKFFRIAVRRSDGSGYVAQIDQETFRETGREDADGSRARYSDFRTVAGVAFAFREEATDRQGRKGVLELTRITANPGLVEELFKAPSPEDQSYFAFERLLASGAEPPAGAKTR